MLGSDMFELTQDKFEIMVFMAVGFAIIWVSQLVHRSIQKAKERATAAKQAAALAGLAAQR